MPGSDKNSRPPLRPRGPSFGPSTPLNRAHALQPAMGWPTLLPSALEMTPPRTANRQKPMPAPLEPIYPGSVARGIPTPTTIKRDHDENGFSMSLMQSSPWGVHQPVQQAPPADMHAPPPTFFIGEQKLGRPGPIAFQSPHPQQQPPLQAQHHSQQRQQRHMHPQQHPQHQQPFSRPLPPQLMKQPRVPLDMPSALNAVHNPALPASYADNSPDKMPGAPALSHESDENSPTAIAGPIRSSESYTSYLTRQKNIPATRAIVWSRDVEEAFMEGLYLIPRVGRRKITVGRRLRGRNELIADYIFKKTRQRRSRKQVSSHIQVLKNLLKDDDAFMNLVADPPDNEEPGEQIQADTFDEFIIKLKSQQPGGPMPQLPNVAATATAAAAAASASAPSPAPSVASTAGSVAGSVAGSIAAPTPTIAAAVPLAAKLSGDHVPAAAVVPANANTERKLSRSSPPVEAKLHHPQPVEPLHLNTIDTPGRSRSVAPGQAFSADWLNQLSTPPTVRRGFHRRGQSSIDLLGTDKVLPVAFRMVRGGKEPFAFTRLLRAQYESPAKPRMFGQLASRFDVAAKMVDSGELTPSVPVVHGTVKVDIGAPNVPAPTADFTIDASFVVWSPSPMNFLFSPARISPSTFERAPDHQWHCVTTVSSMGRTLLSVRDTVAFQENVYQGTERLLLPFTADFWAPFLSGFTGDQNSRKNPDAAIAAITVTQQVYCIRSDQEPQLSFVVLYEFERAMDQFSARTIFRRVRMSDTAPMPKMDLASFGSPKRGLEPPFQRSMSTAAIHAPGPSLSFSPLPPLPDAPLSATMATDFAPFSLEGEHITRPMTSFEPTWQNDLPEWGYMFD